jgi:hypothetical protein
MKSLIKLLLLTMSLPLSAQDEPLPYYEIPSYPESYTAGAVAARMIDGLGFRFYWATEGLREEDLAFKPGDDARTSLETIAHIYDMSFMILNATTHTVNDPQQRPVLPFDGMRKRTLENLKNASDRLRESTDEDMDGFKILFKREDSVAEFPFWNNINGPIADCLWHAGQIVSFRRSSGNPFTDKVSLFSGKVRGR